MVTRIRRVAGLTVALGFFVVAYAAEHRSTSSEIEALRREVAMSRPARESGLDRVAAGLGGLGALPTPRADGPGRDATLDRWQPVLAEIEALPRADLATVTEPRVFAAGRIGLALALTAERECARGASARCEALLVRAATVASAMRGSGSLVGAAFASRVLREVARVAEAHRDRLGDDARADLAATRWSSPAEVTAGLRQGHLRNVLGWLDGPAETTAERVFVRGLVRREMALDATRSLDQHLATFGAAYREGASSSLCAAAMLDRSGEIECRQLDGLREGDRAAERLHALAR